MNTNCLLMELLDCGSSDLALLNDISIETSDILDHLKDCEMKTSLNSILWSAFDIALNEINSEIENKKELVIEEIEEKIENMENKITELENSQNKNIEIAEKEIEKLNDKILELYEIIGDINQLDIFEDTEYYIDYIATSVWFTNNEEIYTEYFKEELENFKDMTGFALD